MSGNSLRSETDYILTILDKADNYQELFISVINELKNIGIDETTINNNKLLFRDIVQANIYHGPYNGYPRDKDIEKIIKNVWTDEIKYKFEFNPVKQETRF